ncbi:UDP-glucuronosyltransferase 2B14 [Agrilus planipennis]|uniref:UDP-glucuronosyltransferase n=1 Tax=Agrilus planipennis TaxID=224129 RepID=A0A7F5RJM9_AGRPL|nr:UDP-glucuronosyltransferase 2B14 [Agrilus planipennis]
MSNFIFLICSLLSLNLGNGYRILVLFPFQGRSHFIIVEPLLKELAARGHNVDVFGHFPQKEKIPRYNDLSIAGTLPILLGTFKIDEMESNTNFFSWFHMTLSKFGLKYCENAFNTTVAKDIRDSKVKYDLIITQIFLNDCMYGFAHHFQAPVVAVSTSTDVPWGGSRIGSPANPSYIPIFFSTNAGKMDLARRFWNTIYYVGTYAIYNMYAMHHGNEMMQEFFGYRMPHLNQLIYNYTSLILSNTHFSTNYVSPKPPNLIEVAGMHILPPKPLPKNIKNELEMEIGTKYKGVIYLSFGSLIAVESVNWNALNAFCGAFAQLPYKVLWKADVEKLPKNLTIPSNVHFEKWMPQRDILCHPNVKVFISHGGLMGTLESIHCGVPTVGFPVFADQELNIENSKIRGFALRLDFKDVTTETFFYTLKELLENPKYKKNVEKYSTLFSDRPQPPLETAVYWTEYVMKYKGAPQLQSVSVELP